MTLEQQPSVCTFDCPDTCSLTVDVDDGRIVKVRGSDALPLHRRGDLQQGRPLHAPTSCTGRSACFIRCAAPARKGSGQFERISWEAALDEIYERVSAVIDRWGPQAVMPLNYAGPHGLLAGDSMSLRFFHRLGATQLYRRALCGGVRSEAWAGTYGAVPGMPARIRRARPAQHRLGQQRDGHQSAPRPQRPPGEARRRPAGRHRPVAHQDRRAGRSASGDLPGTDVLARLVARRRTRADRALSTTRSSPPMCWALRSSWRGRGSGRRRGRPRPAG